MHQLDGQFPPQASTGFGSNLPGVLADNSSGGTGWSSGRQSIAVVSSQPTIVKPWTVYGFGVQGQGVFGRGTPTYGLLGKLFTALLFGGTYTPQNNVPFLLPPTSGVPNVVKLWDGTSDPPFPTLPDTVTPIPPGGYFQGSLQLPQPQALEPGDQIAVAIWLTPSLTNNVETIIKNAGWTIFYDS